MFRLLCAFVLSCMLLLVPLSVQAEREALPDTGIPTFTRSEAFGSWLLRCGKDAKNAERCVLTLGIHDEERRRLAGIAIQKKPDGSVGLARFSLPLGINLLQPPALLLGETATPFVVTHCDRQGCHGLLELNDALWNSFRTEKQGALLMKLRDDRTLRIPFPLDGTGAGMTNVK